MKIKIRVMSIFCIIASLCLIWGCTNNKDNNEYTVIFNLMGGTYNDSTDYPTYTVKFGDTIEAITPTKEGYIFKGWTARLNDAMSNDFEFDKGINSNTVLYAIWHRPQLKYELNGGYFAMYDNIDELIDAFCIDYAAWRGWGGKIDPAYFVDSSWGGFRFFSSSSYQSKWDGLLSFFATLDSCPSKTYFNDYINSNRNDDYEWDHEDEVRTMRYEIQAFLSKVKISLVGWPFTVTADYSDPNTIDGIWAYFKADAPTFYDNSTDYLLTIPHHKTLNFEGWYDNPEFNGTPITVIPKGSEENKVFYAKWQ